jgi:hypothetical protein
LKNAQAYSAKSLMVVQGLWLWLLGTIDKGKLLSANKLLDCRSQSYKTFWSKYTHSFCKLDYFASRIFFLSMLSKDLACKKELVSLLKESFKIDPCSYSEKLQGTGY